MKELFGFRLVAHRIDHEEEVIKRQVFSIVCMFFENDGKSFDSEDGFEDVKVLAEKEVGLHNDFMRFSFTER